MTEPKHVIAVSGGKDSTALALRLIETEPRDYEFICNATGNELPELFEHLRRLETALGKPLNFVRADVDLYGLISRENMIPNFRARFCTVKLKILPTIAYFESLPEGSVLYVGLRADEEARRGLYGEDIKVRFPMREWGWREDDVWNYLWLRGIAIPKRTDCAVCFYQRLGEWWDLWKHYPAEFARGVMVEELYGRTFRSPNRDTWPASLAGLADEFAKGRVPKGAQMDHRPFAGGADACRVCRI